MPADRTLCTVGTRSPLPYTGQDHMWPCRNRCGYAVEIDALVRVVLVSGGVILCNVCARELARRHPDAFEPFSSDN